MSFTQLQQRWLLSCLLALVFVGMTSHVNAQDQRRTSMWQRLAEDHTRSEASVRQADFEALLLELEGNYDAALERIRPSAIQSAEPTDWENYLRLLARSGHLEELAEAVNACEEALYTQRSPVCPLFRGAVEALSGRLDDARRAFELAVDRSQAEEMRTLALVNLAEVHLAQESLDTAARLFRQAARQGGWRASPEAGLAAVSLLRGHYSDARAAMERALEQEPDRGFIDSDAVLELVPGYRDALALLSLLAVGASEETEVALEAWQPPVAGLLSTVRSDELRRWYQQCAPELRLVEDGVENCQVSALAVAPDGREAVLSCRSSNGGANDLLRVDSLRSESPMFSRVALPLDHEILALAWTSARRVRVATASQTIYDVLINTNGEGEIIRSEAIHFPNRQLSGYGDTLQHVLHWDWQNYELSIHPLGTEPGETTTGWAIRLTTSPVFARYFEQAQLVVVLEDGELRAYTTRDGQAAQWSLPFAHTYDDDVQMTYDDAAGELLFVRDGYLFRIDAEDGELLEQTSLRAFLLHQGATASLRTGIVHALGDGSLLIAVADTVFVRRSRADGQRCDR